ncbi:uncharacterized protein SPPG_06947 [Spizellomyces punctatus DAOM BR117]|uniref:Tyrosine specific protein phosphatases domain-containing protein n=1 Tax=Spizellomyces punctatus (strain DAOM BR117) TaxID=645134 RepID=A0A0L0HAN5_SPIPD|nr:uncharacterized protein SPPG_06947 [Spizellomyces punctatus DAOM BR117]KNC97959.1 hypothetical protein SPPG_06947 [Spizellomyces punctatus DAOM BR117]|eukprot:XP_016605999.1 hypothetical protein SPPG_06947 [Spizellomyces punctatus DAOM BR117]
MYINRFFLKAMINRDLPTDFVRLVSFRIQLIVCCLNDAELSYLGAPWALYAATAHSFGISILRLPMLEGSVPSSFEEMDLVLQRVSEEIRRGVRVLCHCRGGVGRAGVLACCYLLRNAYIRTPLRAITYVRARRSRKAIETVRQEEFVAGYFEWWKAQNTS